jgi:hypothetical protein
VSNDGDPSLLLDVGGGDRLSDRLRCDAEKCDFRRGEGGERVLSLDERPTGRPLRRETRPSEVVGRGDPGGVRGDRVLNAG